MPPAPAIPRESPRRIVVDPHRAVLFPNRIREPRIRSGHPRLFAFAASIATIPYIRLSKLERGEVFAREDELKLIARTLDVAPSDLLLDVSSPDFDLAEWFLPFADGTAADTRQEAEFAIMLAAAVRQRRYSDATLTAGKLDRDFGIPPVILSRLENAQKGLDRWSGRVVTSLCSFFAIDDEHALRRQVVERFKAGELDVFIDAIPGADQRMARTRQRVAALRMALARDEEGDGIDEPPRKRSGSTPAKRMLRVLGRPLADGLIEAEETGAEVEAPAAAGPRAFGLRVGRSPLGPGLPGQATLIVDPDRYPQAGGLAVVREGSAYRIAAVASGKDGKMSIYATSPSYDAWMDELDGADVSAVIGAAFI
jgi:hypothetical protein